VEAYEVTQLPAQGELRALGLSPAAVRGVRLLRQEHGHAVYRLTRGHRSFILKWFADPEQAVEIWAYALFEQHGVPTLPVHGRTAGTLLLEDLAVSTMWRLATESDIERADTGAAVAGWYRALHAAGQAVLAGTPAAPGFLRRETDALDAATIMRIGERLGLAAEPIWQLAAEHIEALKQAMRALPETLTYNDFHWTNLALSRQEIPASSAIVFDYHLLGLGPFASDCRNVSRALGELARAAFRATYGSVDEREAALDAPVATLHALHVAVQRPEFPRWARGLVDEVTGGELKANLHRALALL
jgi:hypothetical protein